MIRTRSALSRASKSTLLAALILATSIPAFATCTSNVPGSNVFALTGDVCAAAPGTYDPTGTTGILPITDPGYGFVAYDGGIVNSAGVVTINTQNATGADAVYSSGAGSQVNLNGATTISTIGANAYGVLAANGGAVASSSSLSIATTGSGAIGLYSTGSGSSISTTGANITTTASYTPGVQADSGGVVNLSGGSVAVTGTGSLGLYATGTGSQINATNVAASTAGSGLSNANAIYANAGAVINVTGGSASTTGTDAYVVAATGGATIDISGTAITATGDGSGGLAVNGTGSTIVATGLTIKVQGNYDTTNNFGPAGFTNQSYPGFPDGGNLTLTNSSILTTGTNAPGGYTANGGITTLNGVSIVTSGLNSNGVASDVGGTTNITGGSINTSGNASYGVSATGGGVTNITGTTIGTTGNGSGGLAINGAGSQIDAVGVSITTQGGYDATSGQHSYGVYNGPFGSFTTGGVASLTDTTVTTNGTQMYGVITSTGGSTTIAGGSIATAGTLAFGVVSVNGGSTIIGASQIGPTVITTTGLSANAIDVAAGGSAQVTGAQITTSANGAAGLVVTGSASSLTATGVSVTTKGGIDSATGYYANGAYNGPGGSDTSGGSLTIANSTIVTSGPYVSGVATGAGGTTTLTGTTITTTNSQSFAVSLEGNGASIAVAGGSISAAGVALYFLNGTNQSATFDNLTISSPSGDLIFADPASATINFNNTVANAGTGNLLDAVGGSVITLNANASTLTGAIQTDAASTTNLALTNGTLWTVTGNSTVTNLSNNASSAVFAAPSGGVYKTLTVGNYVGTGGSMTFNAALGAGSGADQLVINGGAATGSTVVMIKNVGGSGVTAGASIPLITAINGGTIAAGAFGLSGPVVADGYQYKLELSDSDQDNLVATPASTTSQVAQSLKSLAQSHESQVITGKILGSILIGANEQVNCSSCFSGFSSFGSFALGEHGRWTLTDRLSLLAGISWDSYSGKGFQADGAPILAAALTYDLVDWGRQRPFFEAGGSIVPFQDVHYTRSYVNGADISSGVGTSAETSGSAFVRAGWVARLTPIDEAAVYGDLTRNWQASSGYSETMTADNPFAATVGGGLDTMDIARVGAQYTHLFAGNIEVNVNGGFAQTFSANFGTNADVAGFGAMAASAPTAFNWFEYGGRLGYRVNPHLVIDAFVLGTLGAEPAGNTIHGGAGLRFAF